MDGGEPPAELRLAWLCGDSHLPEAGGVMEQDAGLMGRMRAAENVYRAVNRYRNARGEQIHSLTVSERRILRAVIDLGLM